MPSTDSTYRPRIFLEKCLARLLCLKPLPVRALGWGLIQGVASAQLMAQPGTPVTVVDSVEGRMSALVKLNDQPDCRQFEESIPDYAVSVRACVDNRGDTVTYWYLTPDHRFAAAGRRVTAGVATIQALTNDWLGVWSSELGSPVTCQLDGFRIGPPIRRYFLWRRNAYVVRLITTAGDARGPVVRPEYIEVQIVRQRPRTGRCEAWLEMPEWE
jgi:hypothetical protein